ncbi:MAG: DinB family protein [Actinobacteria bacterium]|jgi:uncharacterized damage-inducible protein DinB|nr:DinB family protein [Actinomycetota bacterium]
MVVVDDQGRPEPDLAVGELETLVGFLEFHRATLEWKTRGLTDHELRQRIASSTMTLGGLLMHLAYVEEHWFVGVIHDRERMTPWAEVDWKATPDWEWDAAHTMSGEAMRAQWNASVDRSRAALNEALGEATSAQPAANTDSLATLARRLRPSGEPVSLRWILVHMIEEYARHNGHADLLREAIDGQTGE